MARHHSVRHPSPHSPMFTLNLPNVTTHDRIYHVYCSSNGLEVAEGSYFRYGLLYTWDLDGSLTSFHVGICISQWSLQGKCVQKDRINISKNTHHQCGACSSLQLIICVEIHYHEYLIWKFIRLLHAVYSIIFDFVNNNSGSFSITLV